MMVNARRLGRGYPERLMPPDEVVVHEVQGDGGFVVLDLLAI
jgi:hypothetical protein